ncbi:hypothetical protein O9992_27550 [Vibrio lentus]|nr:hypothetical protein [Vibrio lentus]
MVTSQLNAGTQFAISLPGQKCELGKIVVPTPIRTSSDSHDNFSALLVEDNKINAMVIGKFCESINLTVENAYDGLQALDKLASTQYDLVNSGPSHANIKRRY